MIGIENNEKCGIITNGQNYRTLMLNILMEEKIWLI